MVVELFRVPNVVLQLAFTFRRAVWVRVVIISGGVVAGAVPVVIIMPVVAKINVVMQLTTDYLVVIIILVAPLGTAAMVKTRTNGWK